MSSEQTKSDFWPRLYRAVGPIAGGMLLDFADLATFGPIGVFAGFFVGVAVTLWICSIYRFSFQTKVLLSVLAGLYCMIPMTELLPLATLIMASCRFFEGPPPPSSPPPSKKSSGPSRKHVDSKIIEENDRTD